jgi:hypothetical protein
MPSCWVFARNAPHIWLRKGAYEMIPGQEKLWNKLFRSKIIHRLRSVRPLFLLLLIVALTFDVPPPGDRSASLDHVLAGQQFDLVSWIASAGLSKAAHELLLPQTQLADAERVRVVRVYLEDVRRAQGLENQIVERFTDPTQANPATATAALRTERDALRTSLAGRQPLVEAILQEQVEQLLREEGFGLGGQIVPPVRFNMTQLPYIMIISRRDRIERIDQRELRTGIPVDVQDQLEREVDERFNVSSLVTRIGGYGTYPSMLPETHALRFIVETVVHEWTHNYALASYIGLNYNNDATARTINETSASIVQQEVGEKIMRRYYPEDAFWIGSSKIQMRPAEQAFDFRAEMRKTRLQTDALLAAGAINKAERYMEERRAEFVKNGYNIRKLNQAYFAFYGAYNADPGGSPAAGKDPVGPAVQALRKRAPSLYAFVRAIVTVKSIEDVERALR